MWGEYFLEQLQSLLQYRTISDVRGKGLMVGFEIVADKDTNEPFPAENETSRLFSTLTFNRGLVTYPCAGTVRGVAGDTILMAPPLITTREQIDEMMAILHDTMPEFEAQILLNFLVVPKGRAMKLALAIQTPEVQLSIPVTLLDRYVCRKAQQSRQVGGKWCRTNDDRSCRIGC